MRLETSVVVKQKGQQQNLFDKSNKSKKNRKRLKKQMNSVVQRLFETCKEIFGNSHPGFVPSPQEVERLKSVLDNLKPEDVGVTEDMPYFKLVRKEGGPRIVTYLHIYECDKFSIGIFCLPASGMIPLHNHPGMTVFSKLLFGSMHIKSYDWATNASTDVKEHLSDSSPQPPGTQLAKVKMDSDFIAPCNTSILYPADGGNMHCFSALTPCAVLDVLGPPYSDDEGRHCTYFCEFPYHNLSGDVAPVVENTKEEYAWLEEKEKPRDFFVVGAPYMGPKVVEI